MESCLPVLAYVQERGDPCEAERCTLLVAGNGLASKDQVYGNAEAKDVANIVGVEVCVSIDQLRINVEALRSKRR
jgi:hypothetical protein